jgi:hypothetical protein
MKRSAFALAILIATICGCNCDTDGPWFGPSPTTGPAADDKNNITILLRMFHDGNNLEMSKRFKEHTEQDTHWKNLFVIHSEGYSVLYWGTYANEQAAKDNLAKARAYKIPSGERVYAGASVVPIPGKELVGPPEWNLMKTTGEFSVLVAVFRAEPHADSWNMRQEAVDYCKSLRDLGYEAYYCHNPAESDVTVGCFGTSAIQTVSEEGRPDNTGEHPDKTVRLLIVDERINKILDDPRFKYLPVNGRQDIQTVANPVTKTAEKKAATPKIVHIPNKDNPFGDLPPGMHELRKRPNP